MMHANRQWPFQRSGSNGNGIVYGVDYNHDDGGGADDDDDAAVEEFGDFGGDPTVSGRRYLTVQPKQWCTSYVAANRQHYEEYRTLVDRMYPYESTKNHYLKFNFYLSRKTASITELKESITLLIPFDDTNAYTYRHISGIGLKNLVNGNLPKVYFYGKYKIVMKLENTENKLLGCFTFDSNLIRPWEHST